MIRKLLYKCVITGFLFTFSFPLLFSQIYQFRNISVNEGLPGRFIYTINQDKDGFIWLGTGKGLCYFDGFDYHMVYVSDTLDTNYPVSSYETSSGIIFFGFNDGTVHYTEGRALRQVNGIDAGIIYDIVEAQDSLLYIISQSKGIYSLDMANPAISNELSSPVDQFLYCASYLGDNRIVLGTQNGLVLAEIDNNSLNVVAESDDTFYSRVLDIRPSNTQGLYYVATEDDGVFIADMKGNEIRLSRIGESDIFNRSRVQSLMIDKEGILWISTYGNGLIKAITDSLNAEVLSYEVMDTGSGLSGNDIKTCYEDDWENIWIGHFGNGVSILSTDAYRFFRPGNGERDNNIIYVSEYGQYIFAGTSSGYYLFDVEEEKVERYTDLNRSVNMSDITDYYFQDGGSLLIGTEGQGVYKRRPDGNTELFFRSSNNMENYIADIFEDDTYTWLGTRGGVISIHKRTGDIIRYTTSEKLPHNNINQLSPAGDGNIIVATESNRLVMINPREGVITGKALMQGGMGNIFQSFDTDNRGRIWGATRGSGVFCFEKDSLWNITTASGLYSEFCYSILCDSKNNVWIGHRRGFSIYNQVNNVLRTFIDIYSAGADCNENAISETEDGLVLLGTNEGFLVYNPEKDRSKLSPPRTNILSVRINDNEMPLQEVYNLPYSSRYIVEIEYVGLNYSDPGKVYYSYSMENYDTEWSDPTYSRRVTYRLSDGTYRFNILAYSYDGLSDNQIESFVINIKKPFWRTWWFIGASVLLLVAIVIVIIKVRERAQAKAKKILEEQLAERTREVVEQKEEIEYQNREITDSINYAQRIQASLLPPVKRLNESFRGSFVFYRPRDIVSGDFYWFDKISEDKIMIVCADSTGHGVPGAFMSMIGSALLQEIVNRKEITRPSEILRALDMEITTTLNQTGDDTSNDGMDMVVCEYNPRTRLLRFASALRPVILVMDGEQFYIRGNKNSVGGEFMEEKYFDDQEYYLKDNDIVYIFSDGYPDQFGGADGKKLKIVRLKRLIESVKDLDMDDQFRKFSDYFDEWKGDHEQVDDVLLLGFRV